MPFAIVLLPADVEAPLPPYQAAVDAAVRANGGHIGANGVARLDDGGDLVVAMGDFRTTRLSPGVCRILFDAALRTNSYLSTGGSVSTPLKVEGSSVKTPPELGPADVVPDPAVLCARLGDRLTQWNRDTERLRDKGVIGADGQPVEPTPDPGVQPRLASDPSGLAARCETMSRQMCDKLGWKFVRATVTRDARWGVVWRADIAPEPDPSTWMRETCWRAPPWNTHGPVHFASQPLRMFGPTASVAPLPAD